MQSAKGRVKSLNSKGYTLLEVVLVLVLAGALLSIVVPMFMRHTVDAQIAKTKAGLEKIRTAFELYKAQAGYYPSLGNAADDLTGTSPPILDEIPVDGFEGGSDFYYSMGEGEAPCHEPYGGWCHAQGENHIFPNLPRNDPAYGYQDFYYY